MNKKKIRFGVLDYDGLIDLGVTSENLGVTSENFAFWIRMMIESEYRTKLGGTKKIHETCNTSS